MSSPSGPRKVRSTPRRAPDTARKALFSGLELLRVLVDSDTPLSVQELSTRTGQGASSVSRTLSTLADCGFVRKPSYRTFSVDYGILTLSARAARHFRLTETPRAVLARIAQEHPQIAVVALTALWHGQLLYLLRTSPSQREPAVLALGSYPLHLSAPGLRLLLDLPPREALAALADSRRRHGWERPAPGVPAEPAALLEAARARLAHDALVLDGWQRPHWLAVALPVDFPGEPRCALSISVDPQTLSADAALLILQAARRELESAAPRA